MWRHLDPDFGPSVAPRKELRPCVKDGSAQALLDELRVFAYYAPVLADIDRALPSRPPEIQLRLHVQVIAVDRKRCELATACRGGRELGRGRVPDQLVAGQAGGFHGYLQLVKRFKRSAIRRQRDFGSRT